MKEGDRVLISPSLTQMDEWIPGIVDDVEDNDFVGKVITAKTDEGIYYFEKEDMFKLLPESAACMH